MYFSNLFSFLVKIPLALVAVFVFTQNAKAQSWATFEVCEVNPEELANAQDKLDQTDTSSEIANGVGRFWEITSPSGSVSHLWGTMHVTDPSVLNLPAPVQEQLIQSRLFAMESDHGFSKRSEIKNAAHFEEWWQDSFTPPNPPMLLQFADPNIKDWISERMETLGIEGISYDYLTPGGALMYLLGDPCEDFQNWTIPYQDNFLKTLAHLQRIPIVGLEPKDNVVLAMNNPDNATKAAALVTMYGAYLEPQFDSKERARLLAIYKSGLIGHWMDLDTQFLAGLLGPTGHIAIELGNELLVTERNHLFVENVLDEISEGGVFIAVGAFHLPGEEGMIELMRKEGFRVARIPLEGENE